MHAQPATAPAHTAPATDGAAPSPLLLIHPQIAPWLQRQPEGCEISLLSEREQLDQVYLRSQPDNEEQLITMRYVGRQGQLHRWQAWLPWDHGNALTLYAFKVLVDGTQHWLAADGLHEHLPPESLHFRLNRQHQPPDWVREQVFYQIFPDRFHAAEHSERPPSRQGQVLPGQAGRAVVEPAWHEPVDPAHAANSFYGGDLPGIVEKLDYLQQELGISALYLNPIFSSGSNHKYDCDDYFQVDAQLGGNRALVELREATAARGMRLVLDAVVNHTGVNHPWFNQTGVHAELGAAQAIHSPYRSFYAFDGQGRPLGWKGYDSLPVLDFSSAPLREAIYAGQNAVLRHWLRPPYAVDGWRLDVIHMLGEGPGARNNAQFVREFRQAIKQENGQAYVLGEHFSEATRWLQGDQEDGAMNYYGFAHPVRAWLAGLDVAYQPIRLSTAAFERWLARGRATIPYANQLAQLNLLDSHDTSRFFTLLGDDTARMALAATLLFTSPGAPCVYYGDEIGLPGGQDPDCRRPFPWDRAQWKQPLFQHYRELIALRQSRGEWRHGAVQTLAVSEQALVFARYTDWEATVVAVNRGDQALSLDLPVWQLPLQVQQWRGLQPGHGPAAFETLDGGHRLRLQLPARASVLLLSE